MAGANLYDCVCSFGYTFTGGTCAEVNVCDNGENDCNPNATCNHDGPGMHTCACNSGYSGDAQPALTRTAVQKLHAMGELNATTS